MDLHQIFSELNPENQALLVPTKHKDNCDKCLRTYMPGDPVVITPNQRVYHHNCAVPPKRYAA